MIQTIQTISQDDGRCLGVRFIYTENIRREMNGDSHSMSYLQAREFYQKELGDVMGLDKLLDPKLFHGRTKTEMICSKW